MTRVIVAGSFDDLRSRHVRFLQEAARQGEVHVLLWTDNGAQATEGRPPKFTQGERQYFVQAVRYVNSVAIVDRSAEQGAAEQDMLPVEFTKQSAVWAVDEADDNAAKRAFCQSYGLEYRVIREDPLQKYPRATLNDSLSASTHAIKVLVTGCYDWLHSGHVRFFEEVSELGKLYVVVGHDENIKLLKGDGHPMHSENERRYMVEAIRHVTQALISTGSGWLDAEPEIERIKPDIYAVNEDGDRLEKQEYCATHGIEYRVLKRAPKEGLPQRQSTDLRGF